MEGWFWFTLIGLSLDIAGAIILVAGLFISEEDAVKLGVSRISGDTLDENLQLPAVQDRLKQSRRAVLGLVFLVLGFLFQALGSWVSAN